MVICYPYNNLKGKDLIEEAECKFPYSVLPNDVPTFSNNLVNISGFLIRNKEKQSQRLAIDNVSVIRDNNGNEDED